MPQFKGCGRKHGRTFVAGYYFHESYYFIIDVIVSKYFTT